MAFGPVVLGREPGHITGVLPASVDEQNRSGKGQENQEDQEKQPPGFHAR